MNIANQSQAQELSTRDRTLAITATFTAEPVEDALKFWMQELEIRLTTEFAPYNQVFQQLLDPASLLSQNSQGINIVLLRLEDWLRYEHAENTTNGATGKVERNVQDLVVALKSFMARSSTPCILAVCPASPDVKADALLMPSLQQMEALIAAELSHIGNLHLVTPSELNRYPVEDYYDRQKDQLGHIPFTPLFFTALGTALARKIYAIQHPPHKVIILDCDNTLWKGVVGEDGVTGIEISANWQALQAFVIAQQQAGMLICLCSKNNEADVVEVFEKRPDMLLQREHIVSWRINWLPKSENIKALAAELNLGLDSFIFIDDNPVECAEVQASCPDVLTLQLPTSDTIPRFLQHVWAFDHLKVTEEDKQRTELYKQNLERDRFAQASLTFTDFLSGLGLQIEIHEPTVEQLPRVAQLTQRTNQFNLTTIRRSEGEIQQLSQRGMECRVVEVRDRFGDYGLVGIVIFAATNESLQVDTFLLSCRVLGRGVEHRMLNYLAEIAQERGLSTVELVYVPTSKNLPALNFLEGWGAEFKQTLEKGYRYQIPADRAATLALQPQTSESAAAPAVAEKPKTNKNVTPTHLQKSTQLNQIATQFWNPQHILQRIETQQHQQKTTRPNSLQQPFVAPRTASEQQLAAMWTTLLRMDTIGIQDPYFELGGTSLQAVELFAQVKRIFGKDLPLSTLLEFPTIERLAQLLDQTNQAGERDTLVLLSDGGSQPPLFLIHDGDGEIMLYRNLAQRLSSERPVYGVQPYSQSGFPILHTRIPEMAAYYVQQIRQVQLEGPYLLGGMCAGGVLAFETARQLQSQGQTVALVALIDAADPQAPQRSGRMAKSRLSRLTQALTQTQQMGWYAQLLDRVKTVTHKVRNLLVYETQRRIQAAQNTLKMKLLRYYLDCQLPLPTFLQALSVRTVYLFAESEYIPGTPYPGELVLFRATAGEEEDEPYIEVYRDPLLGWSQRTTSAVRVYDVPGGHSSMLQEPNVQVMADQMQTYLHEVLPQEPRSKQTTMVSHR